MVTKPPSISYFTLVAIASQSFVIACVAHGGNAAARRLGDLRGVWQAEFNHDGSRVLVRLRGGEIALWDLAAGTPVTGDLATPATGFVMNREGSLVVVGYADGARVFDPTTAKAVSPKLKAKLRESLPVPAVFSPDGGTLVIFEAEQASIWNARSGERRAATPFPDGPYEGAPPAAIFTEKGAQCFVMDPDGTVTLYETKNWKPAGKPMRHPRLETAYEFGCAASDDGKWIATFDSAGENGPKGQLQVWDAIASKALGAPLANTNGFTARFLVETDRVMIAPARGEASVRELPSMKVVHTIRPHDEIDGPKMELSPDGKWILAWGSDGIIAVHDSTTGKVKCVFAEKATIRNVLMAPDSSACFVVYDNSTFSIQGHQDNYVLRLQLPDLKVAASYRSLAFVRGTALSPDGRRLLLLEGGDGQERLLIFDAANLKPRKAP